MAGSGELPPLVIVDMTGGVAQATTLVAGVGEPMVFTYDADRESDPFDVLRTSATMLEAATQLEMRGKSHEALTLAYDAKMYLEIVDWGEALAEVADDGMALLNHLAGGS